MMNDDTRRPVITLLTDFGLTDGYVASVKAVLLSLCPAARLVDISHEIPAHEILPAALILEATALFFPPDTVHLVVVDPGVGSGRRAVAVRAAGHYFVGPDNGVFTAFLAEGAAETVVIEEERFRLRPFSSTFHGRDLFAPAAAHIGRGAGFGLLGKPIDNPVKLRWPEPEVRDDAVLGVVLHVDHFGNGIASVREADLPPWEKYYVRCRGVDFGPLRRHYAEVVAGAPLALVNSMGRVEVAISQGNAAVALGVAAGDEVKISRYKWSE